MRKENPSVVIDKAKCVGCGLCARDCAGNCLQVRDNVAVFFGKGCIACGHCHAVCPQGAVVLNDYPLEEQAEAACFDLDSEKLLLAMKSRRSVRHFKAAPVEEEKVAAIIEAGRYCPTGSNSQNVAYTILGSRQDEIEALCVKLFRTGEGFSPALSNYLMDRQISDNFFFKGAPLVIVVSSPSEVDAGLASSYMELMAESLGLGVLYSGFFAICARTSEELNQMLRLPPQHKVVTCLVIGYPDVKFYRVVPREVPQITVL